MDTTFMKTPKANSEFPDANQLSHTRIRSEKWCISVHTRMAFPHTHTSLPYAYGAPKSQKQTNKRRLTYLKPESEFLRFKLDFFYGKRRFRS